MESTGSATVCTGCDYEISEDERRWYYDSDVFCTGCACD